MDLRTLLAQIRKNAGGMDHAKMREAIKAGLELKRTEDSAAMAKRAAKSGRQTDYSGGESGSAQDVHKYLKAVHKRVPVNELEVAFQHQSDAVYIAHNVLKAAGKKGLRKSSIAYKELQMLNRELAKAMYSTGSAVGDEFIPEDLSASLIEEVRLQLKVADLHVRINMPTNPFVVPLEGADVNAFLVAEQTSDDTLDSANAIPAATPGTKKITFNAKKLAIRTVWSEEVDQDSIVPIQGYVRNKLARALADAQEDATLNGDTTATHMDDDVSTATDRRKAWKGYRKLALAAAKVDASNAVPSLALMRRVRRQMGKFGVDPTRLAWVVGIASLHRILDISEVLTLDKYGPAATILTGEIGKIDGIPIIVSEFIRQDLNASGVEDGITVDRTVMHLVFTDGFAFGDRLNTTMRSAQNIETDQIIMVVKQRLDFEATQDVSTDLIVGTLYNVQQ